MKLGIFLGLAAAAVGGAAYAHKRRGGTLSMASIKDSLVAAKGAVQDRFAGAKDFATSGAIPTPAKGFGYSEYTVKGDRDLH